MNKLLDRRRLFLGLEVYVPHLPEGVQGCPYFHMNVVDLGFISYQKMRRLIVKMPKPGFSVSPVGIADMIVTLEHNPSKRIIWNMKPWGEDVLADYQQKVIAFFQEQKVVVHGDPSVQHVYLGYVESIDDNNYNSQFPSPVYFHRLHLYEHIDPYLYEPIWTYHILVPFKEYHTKDNGIRTFMVYGKSFSQVARNIQIAIATVDKHITPFISEDVISNSSEDMRTMIDHLLSVPSASNCHTIKSITCCPTQITCSNGIQQWSMHVEML